MEYPPTSARDPIDEQRLQLVANTVPALLAYVGDDARYVWCNEAYRRWFGRSPESIHGQHMREIVGDAAWTGLQHYVKRALAGEEVAYEARVVCGDGQARDVRAAYVPDRDASGRVRGFVALVTDVGEMRSAERALRDSERMLAESQTAAHVGSWEATLGEDPATRSLRWSDETYRIFGYEPRSVKIDYGFFLASIHPDDRELVTAVAGAGVERGGRFEKEYRIVRADGAVRMIHAWTNVERDAAGRTTRLLGTCQDVTELKEADRRKDEFLAMLSHELRNPMAPILTAVEVLRLSDPNDAETAATFRGVIERQVAHMKRLLDDLLDVSRVSQGKIELRRELLDLGPTLQQAIEVSRPLMAERDQKLSVTSASAHIFVDADPARLVQVFGNLLNNAAKYAGHGGSIELELAIEDGEAVVCVRDEGVGMSPEMLERAFDLFVQETRSLDRAQGGLGIGLTMVRSLVKMHGGSVRAFSDGPGRGCEIVVRLPRAPETAALARRDSPQAALTPPERPLRILVVDDNVDAARTLGHLLGLMGHDVALAHDGPSALTVAANAPPELVFIDIGLPGMDGYALADALRANGLDRAALVAVTGYGREEDRRRSREHGFDHHLVKPVDLTALRRIATPRDDR